MAIYDGVVTLDTNDIPVIIELDEDHLRLSASGTEIGLWTTEECQIAHVADTVYAITAEDETIQFVPNQPTLFAAAVNGGADPRHGVALPPEPSAGSPDEARQAPPAQPVTMGLFYALCVITAALGVWALISIVF